MSGLAVVTAARRYRALFSAPGVARLAWPSFVGRLPYGMSTLLLVLAVEHGTGSYLVAGLATATHSAVCAVTAPWLGRLADRGWARPVLVVTGIGYAAFLVAMLAALWAGMSPLTIIMLGGLSGGLNPPIGAVTRVVLPGLAPDHANTAYAFDAICVELTFVLGPALIAAMSVFFSTPYPAVLLTAALGMAGALGVAFAPGLRSRYSRTAPVAKGRKEKLLGLSMMVIVIIGALEAGAYGVMEVAIPAFTERLGSPQAAGAVVAAWSAGSITGGIWFSGMNPRMSRAKLFGVLLALNTVGFSAMLLATGVTDLGLILFLGGMVIAPTTAVEAALITDLAPRARATEAFTWTGTGIYVGFAVGSAVSGWLVGAHSPMWTVNSVAIGMVLVGAILAFAVRKRVMRDIALREAASPTP